MQYPRLLNYYLSEMEGDAEAKVEHPTNPNESMSVES